MTNYAELEKNAKVKSVSFVGGGCAVVTLKTGFHNNGDTQVTAGFFSSAKKFVEGAAVHG